MAASTVELLTPETREGIDRALEKYPADRRRQSAIMPALTLAQDQNGGWLTTELMDAVAAYLEVPPIAVYEVATFYSMYEHKPVGRHKICVCTNVSCQLCGSSEIVDHLKQRLGVDFGEVTEDGLFSLKEVECLAACGGAPMMQVGREYYENLTPRRVDEILEQLRKEAGHG